MQEQHTAKIKIAAIAIGLLFLMSIDVLAVDEISWWKRTFSTLTWDEVASIKKTPKEICAAVRHHVTYKSDKDDHWQSGVDTWAKGSGDCEDYAIAVVDLCKKNGIDAEVVILNPKNSWEGHAVAVGVWEGRIWVSSNGWYERCKSLDDVKSKIAHEFRWKNVEVEMCKVNVESEIRNGSIQTASSNL